MTAQGYAAVTTALPEAGAVQLCQHNCPIETVARAHPEFCEAETKAISNVLGRNVVRLSTISGGGHICTTLVPPAVVGAPGLATHAPRDAGAANVTELAQHRDTTSDEGTH